jgi:hypothetical protein
VTNTMFTVDAGANKGKKSASTSCDSPRQSVQGAFSIANRVSADAPIYTMDLQRSMPSNEPITRGLIDVPSSSDKETMPRHSGECHALYDTCLFKCIRQNQRMSALQVQVRNSILALDGH